MNMTNPLTSRFVDINFNMISVWMITFFDFLFHVLKHYIHRFLFAICQIKIGSDMPFRNYQCMSTRYWMFIVKCYTGISFANNFYRLR